MFSTAIDNKGQEFACKGAVTPKDATQQNCFVEMSQVVAVVTPKDATQPNCLIESGLSV